MADSNRKNFAGHKLESKKDYKFGHVVGNNIGESIFNLDTKFQDKVFEEEGLVPPPDVGDMGRTEQKPVRFEKDGLTYTQVGDKKTPDSVVGPYYQIQNLIDNKKDPGFVNRIMIGTATTGNIRMEWSLARHGQIVPTNWSQIQMIQYMATYAPLNYLIADAQNLIVHEFINKKFEWLFLLEHDVILPIDAFIRLNAHIRSEKNPVVSGLYFTKSIPAEPMVYRGRGNSYYTNFKYGDYVYADGVPTGCLLIHRSVLEIMHAEAPMYTIPNTNQQIKEVFNTPRDMWFDDLSGQWNATTGTSDLDWCTKIINNKILAKAGWKKHAKLKYPFLVDTNIYCKQIDDDGVTYPVSG